MRLIDADHLKKRATDTTGDCWDNYGQGTTDLLEYIDKESTVNAEPTEEQVKEYCRKRCLVIVTSELFNEMKARWSAEPVKHGKWLDADDGIGCTCSICGYDAWADTPFCPNCGAKMNGVTDAEIH